MAMGKKAGDISDYSNTVTFTLAGGGGGNDGGTHAGSDGSHTGHM
jgi:hypothetical protein